MEKDSLQGLRDRMEPPEDPEQVGTLKNNGAKPRAGAQLPIQLAPAKIALALGLVALLFTLVSFVGNRLQPVLGEVVTLFGVGEDLSIPSWYSAIILLSA